MHEHERRPAFPVFIFPSVFICVHPWLIFPTGPLPKKCFPRRNFPVSGGGGKLPRMARRSAAAGSSADLGADTRILVLSGPEAMLKKQHLDKLKAALAAAHGEVETFNFDGKTAALADVLDELRSYSLMQTYKLVLVDEADDFVKKFRSSLERYAASPVDHATLVLRANTWNRGNLDKLINAVGGIVKCDALSEPDAQSWVTQRAASYDRKIERAAAGLLVERVGTSLMKLDSELSKLVVMVADGGTIGPELVEQAVGRGSEAQAWAVQEAVLAAIGSGRPGEAVAKGRELVDLSGQAEVLVGYFVADLMRKFCIAIMLRRSGLSDANIAKHEQMKLWGPRQRLFFQALDRLNSRSVGLLFDRMVEMDHRNKTGLGEPLRNLECFCALLTDEIAPGHSRRS